MTGSTLAAALAAAVGAPAARPAALVLAYQAVGVEAGALDRIAAAVRLAVGRRELAVVDDPGVLKELRRAAAVCGEDPVCLGTLGKRVEARWVVALGLGQVADTILFNLVVVDSDRGRQEGRASRKLGQANAAWPVAIGEAVEEAFRTVDLSPPAAPTVEIPPPPPAVVLAPPPAEPQRRLWPYAVSAAGLSAAALTAGLTFTVQAHSNFATLSDLPIDQRPPVADRQRSLNLAADAFVFGAIATAAVAALLWFLDSPASSPRAAPPAEGGSR